MARWIALVSAVLAMFTFAVIGPIPVAPTVSAAGETPIGRLGDTLRVQYGGVIADVTVGSLLPSDAPPGFGNPPRPPRQQVYRAQIVLQPISVPSPIAMAVNFVFVGVTPTGDAYQPRNTDAPDALQYRLQSAPAGSTIAGSVFWDCYRDLVSNVVLIDKVSGVHLAQWNL
jgi:hypothetical protein